MVDLDTQFTLTGLSLRSDHLSSLMKGHRDHAGKLDFAGYLQGRDPNFLGINRGNYFAKPFGNDSSNVQAVMGGMGYWKRVYYRPDDVLGEILGVHDEEAAAAAQESGYRRIRDSMRELVEEANRPRLPARRLTFHNSLADSKYSVLTGTGLKGFDYDRQGHRSKKHELMFIASAYHRKDADLVMGKK